MTLDPITLDLPMPPNNANGAHGHWASRHAGKKRYWAVLDMRQGNGLLPPPPRKPFAKSRIRSTMYLGAAMDDSNAMRRHKWVEDWLKTRGYIADDRKKCLTWEGFPEQIVRRDGNYRIVITLTPHPPV